MAEVFDILADEDDDLKIAHGDFVVDESTLQHQRHLFMLNPGELGYEPLTGIGLNGFLLDDVDGADLQGKIQREYEADGMQISSLKIESLEQVQVSAEYKNEDN